MLDQLSLDDGTGRAGRIELNMTGLTGRQVQDLSAKLSTTLSLEDLESVVYASTGDRLYVEYVGRASRSGPRSRSCS